MGPTMRNGLSVIALVALIIAILRLLTLSVAPPLKTAAVRQSSRSQPAVIDGAEARFRSRFDYIRPGGQEIGWQKIRWRLRLWGGGR